MLKNIIYSGIEERNKFILTDFPDTIKQAQEFEGNCAKISAVIFAAGGDNASSVLDIIENGLSVESIDSLVQKEHRLKPMRSWDENTFNEHLGNKTEWGIVMGQSLSGKSLVARLVSENANSKVIDLAKMAEDIRPRLETEDGPFEGRVPDAEVEKDILSIISADKASGEKFLYLFDGQHHESIDAMASFLLNNIGAPTYLITCSADAKEIEKRYKEKNEIGDDLGEEDQAMLKEKATQAAEDLQRLRQCWADIMNRVKVIEMDTTCSKESLVEEIRSKFCAKVLLVNHEKRIEVDTACSNLAIKYNMMYISVYQLIKNEICAETELGRALANSKREKGLDFGPVARTTDPFEEAEFSAVHFDSNLVMQLVQQKIAENRTNQRYILLEGFCNSNKLESDEQRLQMRFMDEFFSIERSIGEVVGVISLQNEKEATSYEVPADCFEEPVVEEAKEAAPKQEGEDGEEAQEDAPADGDEPKVAKWSHKDYRWSIPDGRPKSLPVLFRNYKNGKFDEKKWKDFHVNSHGDAAVKALDEFCQRIIDEGHSSLPYVQVIFNDLD